MKPLPMLPPPPASCPSMACMADSSLAADAVTMPELKPSDATALLTSMRLMFRYTLPVS
jgi:hypothetical protein